eukprot:387744-Amphidinium_carterae.1
MIPDCMLQGSVSVPSVQSRNGMSAEHSASWASVLASTAEDEEEREKTTGWGNALAEADLTVCESADDVLPSRGVAGPVTRPSSVPHPPPHSCLGLQAEGHAEARDLTIVRAKPKGRPSKRPRLDEAAIPSQGPRGNVESSYNSGVIGPLEWLHSLEKAGFSSGTKYIGGLHVDLGALHSGAEVVAKNMSPGTLATAMLHCFAYCARDSEVAGMDYTSLHQHFIENPSYHTSSQVVVSAEVDVPRHTLGEKLCRLAAGHMVLQKLSRWVFEFKLANALAPLNHLKAYVDSAAYDETPMRVRSRGDQQVRHADSTEGGTTGGVADLALMKTWDQSVQTDTTKAKLLQSRSDCLEPISFMERTTSEVMKESINRHSNISPFCEQFALQTRVHCTDKAASNLKTERSIVHDRLGQWWSLGTTCSLHSCSTAHTRTFQFLLAEDISGMIRTALCLQNGAAMSCFRKCLRLEIKERLVVTTGAISAEAQQYKDLCLSVFASHASLQDDLQRQILRKLPTGDWRDEVRIQYVELPGKPYRSKEHMSKFLESGLTWVMAGCKPKLYPRHRWTGADICIDQLGKVEMVHKLLSKAFKRFVLSFAKPSLLTTGCIPENFQAGSVALDDTVDLSGCDEAIVHEPLDVVTFEAVSQKNEKVSFQTQENENTTSEKSAAEHAKDRQMALNWIDSRPWSTLVALRLALGPLTNEAFELQQRSVQAQSMLKGEKGCCRDFMVTVAAELTYEKQYFIDLHTVFSNRDVWQIVDKDRVSVAFRAQLFKLLARQGSLVQQLLVAVQKCYPYRMFLLLNRPDMRDEILADAPCLLDPWSTEVKRLHPTLDSEEFLALLCLHACTISTNIAPLEAKHASIRRLLHQRVQSRSMDVALCSAMWVCQNMRSLKFNKVSSTSLKPGQRGSSTTKRRTSSLSAKLRPRESKHRNHLCLTYEVAKVKKRKCVGGGAWRAWTHHHLWGQKGQRPDLSTAASAYREAKATNALEYQNAVALGKRARAAARVKTTSGSSFGPSFRKVKRLVARQLQTALFNQLHDKSQAEQADLLAKKLAHTDHSLQDVLGMTRALNTMSTQVANQRSQEQLATLHEFETTIGKEQLQSLLAALPDLGFDNVLQPVPSAFGPAFVVKHQGHESLAKTMDWATSTGKSNLPAALAQHWAHQHTAVLHSHCAKIVEAPDH